MKKTWLPSSLMTKFWDKPAGTEVSVPVQSELTVYVAVMSGITVTTPLTTMVPLPVIPPLFGHIGTVQGGRGALVG